MSIKKEETSLRKLENRFGTEDDRVAHLEKIRWNGIPTCPRCGCASVKRHPTQKNQWYCRGCHKNFNVRIGTMFHKTKIDLRLWFTAITQMILVKKGISIRSIARLIDVEENTAWRITHKIREAMAKDTLMQKLYGTVEVDEAYIGGLSKRRKNRPDENGVFKKNKRGIGTEHQICIWGVVQREANGVPKRAKVVVHTSKNLDYNELYKLMNEHVDISKSKLMSDGLIGYRKFKNLMPHEYSYHGSGWYVDPNNWNTHTNNIESLWRCIKSNINGCRHRVSAKHLQKYLDEQVFRFNYKDLGSAVAFDRVLELGVG